MILDIYDLIIKFLTVCYPLQPFPFPHFYAMVKLLRPRIKGDGMKVAIFDFDGTIYKHETFSLMMEYLKQHPEYQEKYKPFYRSIVAPYVAYKLKLYSKLKMSANMMQKYLYIFTGKTEQEINDYFAGLAAQMVDDFHSLVIERLEMHHQNGDYVMVVSGSYLPLLEKVLAHLPIDSIIGTKIPMKNGLFDSNTKIQHIQAEKKVLSIQEVLKEKQIDWEQSYAYGDSYSDYPVLKMVGNPVAVCPDEKLLQIATKHKWEILC